MILVELLISVMLLAGAFFSIVGGIGIIRLPEFYSRLHGGGITDTLGAGLVLLGLMTCACLHLEWLTLIKLTMILFFLIVTGPTSCHALAKSALVQGLEPELEINTIESNKEGPANN